MSRARNVPARHRRRKKTLDQARGFWGGRSKSYRTAREAVMRSQRYAYRDRKRKKREFRSLWITRIRAAVNREGVSYSAFINALKLGKIAVNRKIMADLAVRHPDVFSRLVAQVADEKERAGG